MHFLHLPYSIGSPTLNQMGSNIKQAVVWCNKGNLSIRWGVAFPMSDIHDKFFAMLIPSNLFTCYTSTLLM